MEVLLLWLGASCSTAPSWAYWSFVFGTDAFGADVFGTDELETGFFVSLFFAALILISCPSDEQSSA
jgi:ABC-type dipeptide/oligopeptide/nickel transport system permease subunit